MAFAFQPPDPASADAPNPACIACTSRRDFLRETTGTLAAYGLFGGPGSSTAWHTLEALAARPADGPLRYPIPQQDSVAIDEQNEIILCRAGMEVYAFALPCPHQNTALRALPEHAGFRCPKHGSRFQPDGTFISGRATRSMDRLPIHRDGDELVVDPDRIFQSDKDPAGWATALVRL